MANNNDIQQFPYGSGEPIFMCARCFTHLALLIPGCRINLADRKISFPECRNLVSQPPEHQFLDQNGTTWKLRVYCRRCYTDMGFLIVREDNPNNGDNEGIIHLHLPKMLFWNGHNMFSLMQRLPNQPRLPPHEDQPPLFLCKACNTQLASIQGLEYMPISTAGIFFTDYMNLVVVDTPDRYFPHPSGTTWLAFVKCGECNETLGTRSVREENPDDADREGDVGLDMTLLNVWNGSGHEVFSLMRYVPMPMLLPPSREPHQPPPPPTSPTTNGHLSPVEMQQMLQTITLS